MQHRAIEGQVIEITQRAEAKRERAICDHANREDELFRVMSAGESAPWFAIRVMTGCEQAVENVLRAYSIEALVPMRKGKTWERRGRKMEGRPMPVIHGYVLVRFMPDAYSMKAICSVDKVLGFLRAGEEAKRINHSEVERFYQRAMAGEYDWKTAKGSFVAGEKVRITDGPFEGHVAEVVTPEGRKDGDLIVVAIEMFGTQLPVNLPLALVEKL
jgi:transcription termination/antitermination protein NusG